MGLNSIYIFIVGILKVIRKLNIFAFIKAMGSFLLRLKILRYMIPIVIISSTVYTTFKKSLIESKITNTFEPFILNFGNLILNTDARIKTLGIDFQTATTSADKFLLIYDLIGLTMMFLALPIILYIIYKMILGQNASFIQYLIIVLPLYVMVKISGSLLLTGEFPTFISGTIEVYQMMFEYLKMEILNILNSNSLTQGLVEGYMNKYDMLNSTKITNITNSSS